MRNFKDLNIQVEKKGFEGDKVDVSQVLNRPIEVHDFRIEKSKFPDKSNGKRLDMQIVLDGRKRLLFSSSVVLQEMIQKIPKDAFPFQTTIVRVNRRHEFS